MKRLRRRKEVIVEDVVIGTVNRLETLTDRLEATTEILEQLVQQMKEEEAHS